jgi:hypothetical protein
LSLRGFLQLLLRLHASSHPPASFVRRRRARSSAALRKVNDAMRSSKLAIERPRLPHAWIDSRHTMIQKFWTTRGYELCDVGDDDWRESNTAGARSPRTRRRWRSNFHHFLITEILAVDVRLQSTSRGTIRAGLWVKETCHPPATFWVNLRIFFINLR